MSKTYECLEVTNVQVFPFKKDSNPGNMRGLATVVLNDQMLIRGLRIVDGENGLFVNYPKDPDGSSFTKICNPITRQLREHIEDAVITKYQEAIAND